MPWEGSADALQTLASREELWRLAWAMIQDFSFTGIGLGQFDLVLHTLYVPLLVRPDEYVPHAHNMYLEYAVELGLPGAVAFALLVLAFFRQCARAMRAGDPLLRSAGLGLALGMASFWVYGLTDAIAPGARGGLVLWVMLGLGAALGRVASPSGPRAAARAGGTVHSSPIDQDREGGLP